jgi:hypothetical protein
LQVFPTYSFGAAEVHLTTRLRSCAARLRVGHLVSALVVCSGLAALTLPASSSPDAAGGWASFAGASPDQTPGAHDWTADRAALDPPDSADDDDDDDPDATPGAIAATPHSAMRIGIGLRIVHATLDPRSSRIRDGHSLRGPPSANNDSSDVETDDDDDDDDFGTHTTLAVSAAIDRSHSLKHLEPEPAVSLASDNQSLRAPPR